MMPSDNASITVRLAGGLGNQLFQLAAAIYISKNITNASPKVYLDRRFLTSYETLRSYEIGFIAKYFTIISDEPPSFFFRQSSKMRLAKLFDRRIGRYAFVSSEANLLKATTYPGHLHYLIDGYFQGTKILFDDSTRTKIRDSLIYEKLNLITDINKTKRCVGVHIRKGDYVSSKRASKVFRFIPIEYYRRALREIPSINQILVFSDDEELASIFAKEVDGIHVARLSLSLEDEFCLLMSCDDYIISNSTFSWWASYFGYKKGKKIVSPVRWYKNYDRNIANPLLLRNFTKIDL